MTAFVDTEPEVNSEAASVENLGSDEPPRAPMTTADLRNLGAVTDPFVDVEPSWHKAPTSDDLRGFAAGVMRIEWVGGKGFCVADHPGALFSARLLECRSSSGAYMQRAALVGLVVWSPNGKLCRVIGLADRKASASMYGFRGLWLEEIQPEYAS